MSGDDLAFCRSFFQAEGRDPTLTELHILDTYWSDHCRHTTFTTALEDITIIPSGPAAAGQASSLLRFALKTQKNRRSGDFLPCKLRKEPINRGFFGTLCRKNLQVQQAPSTRSIL